MNKIIELVEKYFGAFLFNISESQGKIRAYDIIEQDYCELNFNNDKIEIKYDNEAVINKKISNI